MLIKNNNRHIFHFLWLGQKKGLDKDIFGIKLKFKNSIEVANIQKI